MDRSEVKRKKNSLQKKKKIIIIIIIRIAKIGQSFKERKSRTSGEMMPFWVHLVLLLLFVLIYLLYLLLMIHSIPDTALRLRQHCAYVHTELHNNAVLLSSQDRHNISAVVSVLSVGNTVGGQQDCVQALKSSSSDP